MKHVYVDVYNGSVCTCYLVSDAAIVGDSFETYVAGEVYFRCPAVKAEQIESDIWEVHL